MATGTHKQEGYAILEILKKYTDEDHRVRQQDIIDLVEKETGKTYVRKSIRKNLDDLVEAGYPVCFDKGWYYEHDFCPAELNLLVDILRTAPGITAAQRDEMIRKVSLLGGSWYAANQDNSQLRPANPQFLFSLDVLHEAIAGEKKVLFYYGNYDIDKKLHYRCREDGTPREYLVNPYDILTTNGRYYLLGNVDKYDNISHFRVERIMDIQLTEEPAKELKEIEGCENGIDLQKYVNVHPFMYNGAARKHTFLAKQNALNDVFDWFGMEAEAERVNADVIRVTVTADDVSFDYWCRRYEEYLVDFRKNE